MRKVGAIVAVAAVGLGLVLLAAGGGADTARSEPVSISFSSASNGYALSLYNCAARTCAVLDRTNNSGGSWAELRVPEGMAKDLLLASWQSYFTTYDFQSLNVHFADAKNGWIYGVVPAPATSQTQNPNFAAHLWSTHDGGATWTPILLAPLKIDYGVIQMASHDGRTYLYGASFRTGQARILSTPSRDDDWTSATRTTLYVPAGGTQLQGAFVFAGGHGWFVGGNDRGVISQLRLTPAGTWSKWTVRSTALDGSFAPVTASSALDLLVVTRSAGFVTPPAATVPAGWNSGATWLFRSTDAGTSFRAVRQLSRNFNVTFPVVQGLPAVPTAGRIIAERDSDGTGNLSQQLVLSTDSGRTWRVVYRQGALQVQFVNSDTGFAIASKSPDPLNSSLIRTTDAGAHWSVASP